jgi:hypothetical protein
MVCLQFDPGRRANSFRASMPVKNRNEEQGAEKKAEQDARRRENPQRQREPLLFEVRRRLFPRCSRQSYGHAAH